MEVEFEILASETRQTEQQAEDACSKIFRFSVSMPFPINESMASVECKVHEEQAPKEPYRDIGKRFQGEERPEGVDSDHGVDGVSEVFRENIGQDDRSGQVENAKGMRSRFVFRIRNSRKLP